MTEAFSRYPTSIDGYEINPDFRIMVRLEDGIIRGEDAQQLALRTLTAFYRREMPANIESAWNKVLWFYGCGDREHTPAPADGRPQPRVYDFTVDADRITAAFQQAYGIDLSTAQLHWWRFKALFTGLPEDVGLRKVMGYRAMTDADLADMPPKQKEFYRSMRDKYALPGEIGGTPRCTTLADREAAFLARLRRE